MRKILIVLVLLFSLHADEKYHLGEGVQIASMPLYLGGYFSLDYKNTADENRYRVDDIAVLGYGSYEKLSYMAEFEYKEFYVETHKDDLKNIKRDRQIYIERIYLDYNLDENYMFRAGKFSSSIGFWNMLPINVLRETTSSPMSVEILFPKFTTGAYGSYSSYNDGDLRVDLTLQNNEDIDHDYNNYELDAHYGFGVMFENDEYALKLNGGYFHRTDEHKIVLQDDLYYFLLSAKYDSEDYQLMSEIGSQISSEEVTTDYAGYVQGLYRFTDEHLGIVRAESYKNSLEGVSDDMLIFGYTYRPIYPVAIKSEYQLHSLSEQNQFLFSFSVLF